MSRWPLFFLLDIKPVIRSSRDPTWHRPGAITLRRLTTVGSQRELKHTNYLPYTKYLANTKYLHGRCWQPLPLIQDWNQIQLAQIFTKYQRLAKYQILTKFQRLAKYQRLKRLVIVSGRGWRLTVVFKTGQKQGSTCPNTFPAFQYWPTPYTNTLQYWASPTQIRFRGSKTQVLSYSQYSVRPLFWLCDYFPFPSIQITLAYFAAKTRIWSYPQLTGQTFHTFPFKAFFLQIM